MSKHLHISVKVPLPDEPFAEAKAMVAAHDFIGGLRDMTMPDGAILAHEVVVAKVPRKSKKSAEVPAHVMEALPETAEVAAEPWPEVVTNDLPPVPEPAAPARKRHG